VTTELNTATATNVRNFDLAVLMTSLLVNELLGEAGLIAVDQNFSLDCSSAREFYLATCRNTIPKTRYFLYGAILTNLRGLGWFYWRLLRFCRLRREKEDRGARYLLGAGGASSAA
jgi:hypothetical protein